MTRTLTIASCQATLALQPLDALASRLLEQLEQLHRPGCLLQRICAAHVGCAQQACMAAVEHLREGQGCRTAHRLGHWGEGRTAGGCVAEG